MTYKALHNLAPRRQQASLLLLNMLLPQGLCTCCSHCQKYFPPNTDMACACSMKSSWLPNSQPFPTPAKLRGPSCLRAHILGSSCDQGSGGCPSTLPYPFSALGPIVALGPFWIQGLESTFLSKLADLICNLKRFYYVLGSQTLLQLAPKVLSWGLDHLIQGLLLLFSPGLYPWASRRSNRVQIHLLLHLQVSVRLFITRSESQFSTFLSTVLSWPGTYSH